jgi:hypothetical protein
MIGDVEGADDAEHRSVGGRPLRILDDARESR